jgi:capsular polysaccharide biosynthesis protein
MTESVQLRDLTRSVRRVWWIPVVLAIAGATLGVTASTNVSPLYRSEATVLVGPTDGSITQTSTIRASEDLAAFYADMARRQVVLQPVVRRLGLPQSWVELRNQVSAVVPRENLRIVTVTVTAKSQKQATDIANQLVDGLVSLSSEDPSENAQAFINEQADNLKTMIAERKDDIDSLEAQARATNNPALKSALHQEANEKKNRLIDWQKVYVELASAEPTADAGGLQVIDEAAPVTDKGRAGTPRQAIFGGGVGVAVGVLISWLLYRRSTATDAPVSSVVREEQGSSVARDTEKSATEPSLPTISPVRGSQFVTTPKNGNDARETPLSSRQGYGRVTQGNGRVARTRTPIVSPTASHPRDSRFTTALGNGNDARETPVSSRHGYGRVTQSNGRVAGTRTAGGGNVLPRDMRDE